LEDCPQGVSKECSTNVDLSEYDGEIDFYFEIKDPANTVTSETRTITIDNTEPTVTITSPTEDIGIYGTKSIDLTVTVDETVKTLEYSLDGKAFSTLCNDCSSYSHKKTFSDGDHTIVVKATDYAGNFGEGTVDFSVDSKDPKAIKQYPLDKKYANGEFKIIYTEDNLVSITLKYKRDSESEWQSVTQPCEAGKRKECVFNIREDLTAYDNQYIYYYFIITNHIRSTSSKTYTEKVDVTDPVVTINSPDPTTYDTRRVPMDITVTEDVKLEYSLDGSNYRRICSRCDSYEHSKTFSDGTHTLLIRATDEAENTGQDSVSFTV
jgi:hypothetical protein